MLEFINRPCREILLTDSLTRNVFSWAFNLLLITYYFFCVRACVRACVCFYFPGLSGTQAWSISLPVSSASINPLFVLVRLGGKGGPDALPTSLVPTAFFPLGILLPLLGAGDDRPLVSPLWSLFARLGCTGGGGGFFSVAGCPPPVRESDVTPTMPSETFEGSGPTAAWTNLPDELTAFVLDGNRGGFG
jgi:hypothetical protein